MDVTSIYNHHNVMSIRIVFKVGLFGYDFKRSAIYLIHLKSCGRGLADTAFLVCERGR
jgi:hypothetical protein